MSPYAWRINEIIIIAVADARPYLCQIRGSIVSGALRIWIVCFRDFGVPFEIYIKIISKELLRMRTSSKVVFASSDLKFAKLCILRPYEDQNNDLLRFYLILYKVKLRQI